MGGGGCGRHSALAVVGMIYICDNPFSDPQLGACVYVWGDAPGEAHAALWAVGIDPDVARAHYLNAWEAYRVTMAQFADLCGLGLTVTDKYGPAIWCARRDGDRRRLEILENASRGLRR